MDWVEGTVAGGAAIEGAAVNASAAKRRTRFGCHWQLACRYLLRKQDTGGQAARGTLGVLKWRVWVLWKLKVLLLR
jgi:hypothetical protein